MARKDKRYHYIYKITCLKNGKYYIGMHSTMNLDDGYMGGGKKIKNSIRKYGIDEHHKEILEFFKTREELKNREIQLVNEDLLNDPLCMNINLGGEGGWLIEWQRKGAIESNKKNWKDPIFIEKMKSVASNTMKKLWKNPDYVEMIKKTSSTSFKGKKHVKESKDRIGSANKIKQKGEKNSQFGKCWIHNINMKINKKIKKDEIDKFIREGWLAGLKMDFF